MSTSPNPAPRKPVQRAFSRRLVGLPPEPEDIPAQVEPAQTSVTHAQSTVAQLMDAVASAMTDEQVKQALHQTFSPKVQEAPRRTRGRPRLWSSDAERKRAERATAVKHLEQLLDHFKLKLETRIAPKLREQFELDAETYAELLRSDRIKQKLVDAIRKDLKQAHRELRQDQQSTSGGLYMRGAPQGKGKLVSGGYDSKKIGIVVGIREEQEHGLSKPDSSQEETYNFVLPGDKELPTGDRRRVRPRGSAPDDEE